jgi:hypothetical protein
MYIKQRIFAVLLVLGSIAMIYYGWHRLYADGVYYPKMAAFSPLLGVGGIFLFFFPTMGGRPETTRDRVIVLAVFAVGMIAGLINWLLMDPGLVSDFGF